MPSHEAGIAFGNRNAKMKSSDEARSVTYVTHKVKVVSATTVVHTRCSEVWEGITS